MMMTMILSMRPSFVGLCVLVLLCCGCSVERATATAADDFWARAQDTLLLSNTRSNRSNTALPGPSTGDPIVGVPKFLPLCGNGRIDTMADYTAYYADARNLPIMLSSQELLYNRDDVVDPTLQHAVRIFADEECDDGNRDDQDG